MDGLTVIPGSERFYIVDDGYPIDLPQPPNDDGAQKRELRRLVAEGEEAQRRLDEIEEETYRAFREFRGEAVPAAEEPAEDPADEELFDAFRAWQGRPA